MYCGGLTDICGQIDVQSLGRRPRSLVAWIAGQMNHRVDACKLCRPGVVPFRKIRCLYCSIVAGADIK